MNSENFIKLYFASKNLRYTSFLKSYKREFLNKRLLYLKTISLSLNKINKHNFTPYNYKFLIGPWLDEFVKIYLLRNYHFKKIRKKINISKKETILISSDFSDFISNSNDKNFNLNFFLTFSKSKLNFKKKFIKIKKNINLFHKIKFFIYLNIIKFLINKKTTLLINSRFDKSTIFKLALKSKFKILPFFHYSQYPFAINNKKSNINFRQIFKKELNKKLSYEESKLISENIPSAYLENFKSFYKFSKKIFSRKPLNIFTTTSHLDDEILKFSLMNWGKKKPNILISQHGGNYSISNQYGLGYHDYEISDKYYTWGYKNRKKDNISNAQQVYNKFKEYKLNKSLHQKKYFTFILGPNIQYDFQRYVYQNVDYNKLYKARNEFVENFNRSNKIIFKKYHIMRYLQQDKDDIIKKKINIKKNQITNNSKIIYKSKLLIFDYFSTMFFEIINMDIPFIFILDEKNFYLSKEGNKLIQFLKKNNLLFKSGKKAAKYLNKIEDYDNWWNGINKTDLNRLKNNIANIRYKNLHFWLQQFKNKK